MRKRPAQRGVLLFGAAYPRLLERFYSHDYACAPAAILSVDARPRPRLKNGPSGPLPQRPPRTHQSLDALKKAKANKAGSDKLADARRAALAQILALTVTSTGKLPAASAALAPTLQEDASIWVKDAQDLSKHLTTAKATTSLPDLVRHIKAWLSKESSQSGNSTGPRNQRLLRALAELDDFKSADATPFPRAEAWRRFERDTLEKTAAAQTAHTDALSDVLAKTADVTQAQTKQDQFVRSRSPALQAALSVVLSLREPVLTPTTKSKGAHEVDTLTALLKTQLAALSAEQASAKAEAVAQLDQWAASAPPPLKVPGIDSPGDNQSGGKGERKSNALHTLDRIEAFLSYTRMDALNRGAAAGAYGSTLRVFSDNHTRSVKAQLAALDEALKTQTHFGALRAQWAKTYAGNATKLVAVNQTLGDPALLSLHDKTLAATAPQDPQRPDTSPSSQLMDGLELLAQQRSRIKTLVGLLSDLINTETEAAEAQKKVVAEKEEALAKALDAQTAVLNKPLSTQDEQKAANDKVVTTRQDLQTERTAAIRLNTTAAAAQTQKAAVLTDVDAVVQKMVKDTAAKHLRAVEEFETAARVVSQGVQGNSAAR